MAKRPEGALPISRLTLPDEQKIESYFWFTGNVMDLARDEMAIASLDPALEPDNRFEGTVREMVQNVGKAAGYSGHLAVARNVIIVRTDQRPTERTVYELLQHLPHLHTVLFNVADPKLKIARTSNPYDRLHRVQHSLIFESMPQLPTISQVAERRVFIPIEVEQELAKQAANHKADDSESESYQAA